LSHAPPPLIEAAKLRRDFKFEIANTQEGKTLLDCYQCGICTSSCPFSEYLEVKPHQVIRFAILGMRDHALGSKTIWACSTCFSCSVRCPQGVNVADVMFAMKNIAAREKGAPAGLVELIRKIYTSGRSGDITEIEEDDRKYLGIPPAPRADVAATQRLLRWTNMSRLIQEANA
jgi:heterodisulfide reductase subunit C